MNLFIPIILIIISLGTFFTFIDRTYQEVKDLQEIKNDYEDKINKSEEIKLKRKKLAQIYAELEKNGYLERLNKMLPDHINNIELIVDLDRIARRNNIRIADISLVNEDALGSKKQNSGNIIDIDSVKNYESTNLSFSFISSYGNFKNFIDDIRKSLRLLDIKSISFKRENDNNDESIDNFKFNITVRAYWLKDN